MIKEYYHDIDMNANQLFNSRLHNISTAARIILGGTLSTSDKGYMVYDTDLSSPYFWDGTQWLAAGGGGIGPGTTNYVSKWDGSGTNLVDSQIYDDGNYVRVGIGGGSMGFPYEKLILEAPQDMKFGAYTSVTAPNLGGASYVLGYTNFLTNLGYYPGFEFQMSGAAVDADNLIRYNFLQRNASGVVVAANPNIFNLYADSRVSFKTLIGTGTEMVVANASGFISRQPIPTGAITAVTATSPLASSGGATPDISIQQANSVQNGYLTSIDWNVFNLKQDGISLTTSGTSGAATFISNTLNIPQYQSALTNPVTGTGTATRVAFWDTSSSISSDSALYWDNVNKRLGIGTATPSKALDVSSDALVNGALLGIGPNTGSSFPNTNIVFGTSALAANTTGYYNAAIGTNAMNANTTGYYNLAIGYDALKVNLISRTNIAIGASSLGKFIGDGTVNGGNTGIGALTLRDNVTGLYNTAIGYGSILSVTGSSYNSAIGYSALRYATTAAFNTAIGTYAGSYYGSAGTTTLTTANNGTFIGYYSRPLNNSSTNEIVIGYNSVGNGDNSTTIGNSNTTSTNLFGALGFGSTPSYGTSGQVLTSSGAGVAPTWTTVTSGSTRSVNVVSTNTAAGSASGTDYVYLVSGTTTITLPTPVGNTNLYTIKRVGTNTVSIATTSGTIDGSTSPITINVQYVSLDLISDGTNWNII